MIRFAISLVAVTGAVIIHGALTRPVAEMPIRSDDVARLVCAFRMEDDFSVTHETRDAIRYACASRYGISTKEDR